MAEQTSYLTKAQTAQVTEMHAEGHTVSHIARKLGLTREYVQAQVKTLNHTR